MKSQVYCSMNLIEVTIFHRIRKIFFSGGGDPTNFLRAPPVHFFTCKVFFLQFPLSPCCIPSDSLRRLCHEKVNLTIFLLYPLPWKEDIYYILFEIGIFHGIVIIIYIFSCNIVLMKVRRWKAITFYIKNIHIFIFLIENLCICHN